MFSKIDKPGVYLIINTKNNKYYVGSSVNISKRWINHQRCLKLGIHKNPILQNSYNKYGSDSFVFIILQKTNCIKSEILSYEQFWLDMLFDICPECLYNICKSATSTLGRTLSKETKEKISKSHKGKKLSYETRKKMCESHKGNNNGMYGKKHTEETKIIQSQHKRGMYNGDNNPFYGKKHTDKTKKIIGNKNRGKISSRRLLNIEQVLEIKKIIQQKPHNIMWKDYYCEIGKQYNVSSNYIHKIKKGQKYGNEY